MPPVLHIGLNHVRTVPADLRQAQGTVVVASLFIIWTLAVLENRSLRRAMQKAVAQERELNDLRVQREVATHAEQAKAQFLANVSHEIRTPMTGILGMSEIVLKTELGTDQRNQIELIRTSAEGLLEVINDILEYSKIEAGKLSIVSEPFDLEEVAGQVANLFRTAAREKTLEMHVEFQEGTPKELDGDASRLRQVLLNLISNSIKFTPSGWVRVRFSLADMTGQQARIRCEVSDSGIGIDTTWAGDLFKPFAQGDNSSSRRYEGSGLGLVISKHIVEAQGGNIGAAGSLGEGATFWFELPYMIATDTPTVGLRKEGDVPRLGGRILLAEDNQVNQLVLVQQLESLGMSVVVTNNGNEALEALERDDYSMVLMDCQMPELDGYQATRRIREKGYASSDLPIVALTAHVFDEDRQRCFDAGMNDFISKPIMLEQLTEKLGEWLGHANP